MPTPSQQFPSLVAFRRQSIQQAMWTLAVIGWLTFASSDRAVAQYPQTYPPTQGMVSNGFPVASPMPSPPPAAETEEAATESRTGSLFRLFRDGGPLMYPIGLCSLLVCAVAVERFLSLRRNRVIPRPFVRRFMEKVEEGQLDYDEAVQVCEEFDCPVADVFMAAVKRWGRPAVEVEQAVMDAGERISDELRRFLRVFSAASNIAPLLGLLGTVVGMIQAFNRLANDSQAGSPELLAGGISQALITTAAGLSVAIPAYLFYSFFAARAEKYLHEIDHLSQSVVECVSAEGQQSKQARRKLRRAA
jgi:biopolymer transport protein ExbB